MMQMLYGIHSVKAYLEQHATVAGQLYILAKRRDDKLHAIIDQAKQIGCPWSSVSRHELDKLSHGHTHQGVVLILNQQGEKASEEGEVLRAQTLADCLTQHDNPIFLVLDGVQDPHNLGACLRSADAAGVVGVIIPKDKSCKLTPVVRKVACGAAETVPLFVETNLRRALQTLKDAGVWLVGMSGEAKQSIYDVDLTGPIAMVYGSEGFGLRKLTAETCDYLAHLPMAGSVESLNVSVAVGVGLFETVRQRR